MGDVLATTRQFELIAKKEFLAATHDSEHKAFVIYITGLNIYSDDEVHPLKKDQIA